MKQPSANAPQVESVRLAGVSDDQALAIGRLLAATWPRPDRGPVERAAQVAAMGAGYDGPVDREPLSLVVRDGDLVIAHALTFCRVVETSAGELPVMALAMVASDAAQRGQGLGAAVVAAAFARVDSGAFPCSFFQTSFAVRPFYERFGCVLVENRVVNSLNEEDPTARPFWDDVQMRYPGDTPWPAGDIDLRGRGY